MTSQGKHTCAQSIIVRSSTIAYPPGPRHGIKAVRLSAGNVYATSDVVQAPTASQARDGGGYSYDDGTGWG
jgi:hypothetical protein